MLLTDFTNRTSVFDPDERDGRDVLGGSVGLENAVSAEVPPTDSTDAGGADFISNISVTTCDHMTATYDRACLPR